MTATTFFRTAEGTPPAFGRQWPSPPGDCGRRGDDARVRLDAEVLRRRPDLGRAQHPGRLGDQADRDQPVRRADAQPVLQPSGGQQQPAPATSTRLTRCPTPRWFTNRAGSQPLTAADIDRGPDTDRRPGRRAPGRLPRRRATASPPVSRSATPSGQRWFLKFDAPGYRGMSTGTEVTVTKLMWALGYHVPENHIAYLRRDQLVVGESAKFTPAGGSTRADARGRHRRPARARQPRGGWQLPRRRQQEPARASRSAGSASPARGPTIRTTSCRTRTGASCAATACSRPG